MEFIVGGLLLILILYIVGYLMKKKNYKEIDRLEAWKIDIMNRPVLDEFAKVKKLNMSGQTEELFDKWRKNWDEIITTTLPNVEEKLFDAEDYIDKYRFIKAKEALMAIENDLRQAEEKIEYLIEEIKELVGSEEKNRQDIEELKETYLLLRKNLLAHRHSYETTEKKFESLLEQVVSDFAEYEKLTVSGNYLEAREIVLRIRGLLEDIRVKMELIPALINECRMKIPTALKELASGYQEMCDQGYILDHLQIEDEMKAMENQLQQYLDDLDELKIENVEEGMEEIKNRIDSLYDLLEDEVLARQYIQANGDKTKELLQVIQEANERLKAEIANVQQIYHISDSSMKEQTELDQTLNQLIQRYEVLEQKILNDETAYSLLRNELLEIKEQLEKMKGEYEEFTERLQTLRKDEMAAKDKVRELTRKISEAITESSTNNIPGLPESYLVLVEDAKEAIIDVKKKLEEKPLDITAVQTFLEIAVKNVEKLVEQTYDLVETVKLAERVIQYGNRYRSRYPSVQHALNEAEQSFRGYDYYTALEVAATAIEEIEPGALKKIEQLLEEEQSFV